MKNNTSRFSKLILTCVPFLLIGTTLVNAEETSTSSSEAISTTTDSLNIEKTAETLSSEDVTTTSTSEDETETQKVKTTIPELTFKSNKIEGKKGDKGKLTLNEVDGVTLTGTFTAYDDKFVSIDKDGNWEILSNEADLKTKSFPLEYTFSNSDKEKLKDLYLDQDFSKAVTTEKVTYEIAKKDVADISLVLSTEIFKGSEGTFEVKTKDGTVVTGDFDKLSSNDLTISKIEGKNEFQYKIANEETFELKETLIFTLDDASIAALEKENEDKEIPTKYEIKFAQKNIVITFKNKNITTTVGGVGRLDPANYGEIVISGTFVPLTNNNVISIDDKGNWKALSVTSGTGILTPGFNVDPAVVTELEKAYPDFNLNITNSTVPVTITQSTSTSDKTYAPTAKSSLPQTGEEKLRFFSIIGVLLIGAVAAIFFVKRKKDSTK